MSAGYADSKFCEGLPDMNEFKERTIGLGQSSPPAAPLSRLIRECDLGRLCPHCGSSFKKRLIFKTDRCIQPECKNYLGENY